MTLPALYKPDEVAGRLGIAERRVRERARVLGTCLIMGNRMAFTEDEVLAIMESFPEKYRGMVKELTDQTIREYDCTTHAEKMLAETAAGSFVRYIDSSKRYNRYGLDPFHCTRSLFPELYAPAA